MVESETSGLSEKIMLDAVKFGHENFVPVIEAIEILDAYLTAEYEGGRHQTRIDKIPC